MEEEPFILPVNYTGEAMMTVYTDKTENNYRVNIVCRDGSYSIKTESGNETWNYALVTGDRCVLSNDKFPENSVTIDNFQLRDSLIYDFDLSKFDLVEEFSEELIYWDGSYKHVLNFSDENKLPNTIFIYKNDKLVKAIQYENINIEE